MASEAFRDRIAVEAVKEERARKWMLLVGRAKRGGSIQTGKATIEEENIGSGAADVESEEDCEQRWILIGSSGGRPRSRGDCHSENTVKPGFVIGIREPVWDADADGQSWKVAVRWGVVGTQGSERLDTEWSL